MVKTSLDYNLSLSTTTVCLHIVNLGQKILYIFLRVNVLYHTRNVHALFKLYYIKTKFMVIFYNLINMCRKQYTHSLELS